jgi:hypothetical protein
MAVAQWDLSVMILVIRGCMVLLASIGLRCRQRPRPVALDGERRHCGIGLDPNEALNR